MTDPPIIAFFNNKGGVGKTSLAYHLAWMFAERGGHWAQSMSRKSPIASGWS